MKKLITVILILALLLPAAAGAVSRPRIVGYWYMLMDGDFYPEMMPNLGNYDYVLSAYFFSKDGYIMLLENDIKDNVATPTFASCGKWEKKKNTLDTYIAQIAGIGECEVSVEDNGNMYMTIPSQNNLKIHFRWMFPFSPYSDYSY